MIHDIVVEKMGFKLFFVESVCDDPKIVEQNIMVRSINNLIVHIPSSICLDRFIHFVHVSNTG